MASNLYLFFIAFNVFEKCNYYNFFNVGERGAGRGGGQNPLVFIHHRGGGHLVLYCKWWLCPNSHAGSSEGRIFGHMMSLPPRLNRWWCPNSHSTSPNLPRLMRSRRRSLWGCQRTQLANFLSWTWKPHAVMSRRDWGHADEKCIRKCGLCANFSISRYHGCSG